VVQADGKIVVDGYTQDAQQGGGYKSELVRYNADGSMDLNFGVNGIDSAGPGFATGSGVAIQADGKIVTAGAVFGSPNHFALARYNSDGSFDTSFGTGGKVVTDFGSTVPFGLLIEPDGRIVLTGGANGSLDFGVARFNVDGSFDTSFGTGGKVTTNFGGTAAAGYGVAGTPDGKIVVAGIKEFVGSGFDYDFAVARYNSDGSLDTSFGAGGKVTTDFASTDDIPYTVTVQADGKVVVAGITDSSAASNFGLVRYNLDGSLDASFGSGGKVVTDFGANFEAGNSVTMQADGKMVVAGFSFSGSPSNADFALARYNSNGSLDTSFGTGGKVKTSFGSNNDLANSVVIQPDGKILVGGSTSGGPGTGADYALVRYNSDGSLDTSFGNDTPLATGTPGNDGFTALSGKERIDAGAGHDTVTFNFSLTAAAFSFAGGEIIVDTASSHTILSGVEEFHFLDGTVNNDDGDPLVNDLFYYARNRDVWNAHIDADLHYRTSGYREGRSPNETFTPAEYLASNPDLIQAFGLNLAAAGQHYITNGFNEHRATQSFDAAGYLASNPDLIQAFGFNLAAAEQHYVTNGFNEHRATHSFDALEYLVSNPDLIQAFGTNTLAAEQHYITNGFNEHRATHSFNALEYLASNPDLIQAFGTNTLAAEQHYLTNGFNEHRATQSFDAAEYLASNPDLIQAFGFDLTAAEAHYITNGFNEHRATHSFDAVEYLASNPDLIQAFGANTLAAEQHYIQSGFNEGRATLSFNAAQYLANYADLGAAFGNNLAAAEQHYITNGFNEGRTDHAPVINGDGGDNTLVAKNGAIVTGGAGADNFVFNSSLLTPATITDFAAGTDHLQISAAGFGHGLVAGNPVTLVTAATASAATNAGTDGYFIFDNAHTVWWDPTGGSGSDAIALAKLTGVAALHMSDFLVA
jgi:uncharacterized delta-60 repeat protein